jgi:hypothetical protein
MTRTSGRVMVRSGRVPTTVTPARRTRADAAVSAASALMNADRGLVSSSAEKALRGDRVRTPVSAAYPSEIVLASEA